MIAAASECRVSLPPVIEYDADRADLPLVVVPVSIPSMTMLLRDRLDEFAGLARVRIHTDWTDDEDVLAARMSDATVVMSTGFRASARLLERIAGRVRCITFCGTGAVSFIDLEAARRLGITICNAVHYGDNAVAEHAIALMFEHTHRVGELNARTHQGGWPGADITELSGRTLGIIGFGGIGRRVARLAHGISLRLLVWGTLLLAAVLVGIVLLSCHDSLAAPSMEIKLPEDPTKAYITLGILFVAAVMFFTEVVPLPITALLVPVALSICNVIPSKTAFGYFGDPTVVLFMAMFIVGEATFITGFADKVGNFAVRAAKGNPVKLLVYIMTAIGLLSTVLSNTGTTVVAVPMVLGICMSARLAPGKLLMPVAFASSLGSDRWRSMILRAKASRSAAASSSANRAKSASSSMAWRHVPA